MLKIENFEVLGWEHVIRGMRNPMNSWEKSDSNFFDDSEGHVCNICQGHGPMSLIEIGQNDYALMKNLRNAGTDHRKFMRMITVYLDITAPLYWWKEFDTYRVGVEKNSCSTMHKIHAKEFVREDFSYDHLITNRELCWNEHMMSGPTCDDSPMDILDIVIDALNVYREKYLIALKTESETGLSGKDSWLRMSQLLPTSYNQKRTVMLNYEVLANIYKSRKNHRLDEWHTLCDWISELPYSELITGEEYDVE